MFLSVFRDFIAFLKNPIKAESYTEIPARTFSVLLFIALIVVIPFALLAEWLGAGQFDSFLEEIIKENKLLVIILGIFLAPLLEEPIFRLHLNLKKSSIWWGLILSLLLVSEQWFFAVAFMVYMVYLLISVIQKEPVNLKFVVYTSAFFFGVVHLGNYRNFDFVSHFYWVPFLAGAQLFIGLILSYIRLNHGMSYAMLFHGTYNAILIIPSVYFYEG